MYGQTGWFKCSHELLVLATFKLSIFNVDNITPDKHLLEPRNYAVIICKILLFILELSNNIEIVLIV